MFMDFTPVGSQPRVKPLTLCLIAIIHTAELTCFGLAIFETKLASPNDTS